MAIKHYVAFSLYLLVLTNQMTTADRFDSNNYDSNSICFTSEDCHRNADSQSELPLFCRNKFECLCNRQQLHSHSSLEMAELLTKCVKCTAEMSELVDPCTDQDPYSFCNQTASLCECSLNGSDINRSDSKKLQSENDLSQTSLFSRSICLHNHINKHMDMTLGNNQSVPDKSTERPHHIVTEETVSEWLLTILLAYVLPCSVIFVFVYFVYKQGCFCGRRDNRDSEMILYRQL